MRVLLLLLLTASIQAAEVRVFAAASLTEALTEVARDYKRSRVDRIAFNFGASSFLARQIERRAPADVFLSADERQVDNLSKLVTQRARVLSNTLVIVVPRVGGRNVRHPRDLTAMQAIALAEPRHGFDVLR